MRLLVLADCDELRWRHGAIEADVILALGDLSDSLLLDAAGQCRCRSVLAVRGNHDGSEPFPAQVVDLHMRVIVIGGLRFGGFEGCVRYKPRGHHLYSQHEAAQVLERLPPVDVLVAHNSPRGIHERDGDVHVGFDALNDYIRTHQPRLLVHGHQHVNADTAIGATLVAGVFGHRAFDLNP